MSLLIHRSDPRHLKATIGVRDLWPTEAEGVAPD